MLKAQYPWKKILTHFMPAGYAHFQIKYLGILLLYQVRCPKVPLTIIYTVFLETPKNRTKHCPDVNSHLGTLGDLSTFVFFFMEAYIPICLNPINWQRLRTWCLNSHRTERVFGFNSWLEYVFQRNPCTRCLLFFLLFDTTAKILYSARNCSFYSHDMVTSTCGHHSVTSCLACVKLENVCPMFSSWDRKPALRNWWRHPFKNTIQFWMCKALGLYYFKALFWELIFVEGLLLEGILHFKIGRAWK